MQCSGPRPINTAPTVLFPIEFQVLATPPQVLNTPAQVLSAANVPAVAPLPNLTSEVAYQIPFALLNSLGNPDQLVLSTGSPTKIYARNGSRIRAWIDVSTNIPRANLRCAVSLSGESFNLPAAE
jgi:hypothetical protein